MGERRSYPYLSNMLGLPLERHGGPPELRTRQMRVIFREVPENKVLVSVEPRTSEYENARSV